MTNSYDKLRKLYLDDWYLLNDEVKCFWCDKILVREEATIDHLISKNYIKKNRDLFNNRLKNFNRKDNWRIVCDKCNHQRCCITVLYNAIITCNKKEIVLSRYLSIKHIIDKYEKLIQEKVPKYLLDFVLGEIRWIKAEILT